MMKAKKWITIDSDGKNAKITARRATIEPWQICFPIQFEIPDEYFNRPAFSAEVRFPDVERVESISKAEINGVEELIHQQLGLSIKVNIDMPEEAPQ